jgi:hypothetical protein
LDNAQHDLVVPVDINAMSRKSKNSGERAPKANVDVSGGDAEVINETRSNIKCIS